MSATIFKHEFRARLQSVLIWSGSIAAMTLFFFSIFPAFADQSAEINQLLSRYPPELLAAFGMGRLNLAEVNAFFSFVYVFIQLCLAIQAGNFGFGLVSIEEAERTADFLLTRPVSRRQVLTSKLLGALCSLLLTWLVTGAVCLTAVALFNDGRPYDPAILGMVLSTGLAIQLFFLLVGLAVSLLVRRVRSVTPYSLGLGFGMYVLAAFSGVFGDVKLEYITPFKHLDPTAIVVNDSYNVSLLLLNLAISLVALVLAYPLYLRRDIPAVS